MSDEKKLRFLKLEEHLAYKYFEGLEIFKGEQDSKKGISIFDTRSSFLKKLDIPEKKKVFFKNME